MRKSPPTDTTGSGDGFLAQDATVHLLPTPLAKKPVVNSAELVPGFWRKVVDGIAIAGMAYPVTLYFFLIATAIFFGQRDDVEDAVALLLWAMIASLLALHATTYLSTLLTCLLRIYFPDMKGVYAQMRGAGFVGGLTGFILVLLAITSFVVLAILTERGIPGGPKHFLYGCMLLGSATLIGQFGALRGGRSALLGASIFTISLEDRLRPRFSIRSILQLTLFLCVVLGVLKIVHAPTGVLLCAAAAWLLFQAATLSILLRLEVQWIRRAGSVRDAR